MLNLTHWTDDQLQATFDLVENLITHERDWRNLPPLNESLEKILAEQVRRDLIRADLQKGIAV